MFTFSVSVDASVGAFGTFRTQLIIDASVDITLVVDGGIEINVFLQA